MKPFLNLNPPLDASLLSNRTWVYGQMDKNNIASKSLDKTQMDYNDLTAAAFMPCTTSNIMSTNNRNTYTKTSPFNENPWAHHYLSNPITPNNVPTTDTNTANDSMFKKTTTASCTQEITAISTTSDISINSRRAVCVQAGASDVQSVRPRVRPVSFSLPKRSCVLLHQSAAIFIQAGQNSGLSGKQEGVTVQEKAKLKSLVSADSVGVAHWDTATKHIEDSETAIQHTNDAASISNEMKTGTEVSLCNRNVIRVEDSVISGNGSQFSLCNDNGTGAQASNKSGPGADLYLNSGIAKENPADNVSTVVSKNSVCGDNQPEAGIENCTELNPPQQSEGSFCPKKNQPHNTISGAFDETKESSIQTMLQESSCEKKASTPSRPKEPFCHVQSRDGSRVLLWPSEMVSYTKTTPSISYSINPLLYDFRAHNRAKEGGEDKKGGLEEGSKRIKPSVIKQTNCQHRQGDMGGGWEEKLDEREDNEGGQAGNPMEVVDHCSSGEAVMDQCGCCDESALQLASECHLTPTQGLQKTGRRRGRRGGVRRGRRKSGEKAEIGRKIISGLFENQMKRESAEKKEQREKGMLSNLGAHRLVGGREKRMRAVQKTIQGDQMEQERAGRNDKKRGELLSNLPLNQCNRCNQLCVQVKREANQCQSQQSGSGWGQGLRTLLCRGAACNSVISPSSGSVIQMPCCSAITPIPDQNDRGIGETEKNTQAGKEDHWKHEEQRYLGETAIRIVQSAENMCNLVINSDTFPHRETAQPETEIGLVPAPHTEAACDPVISLIPASFRETACSQRQTIPAEDRRPALGPAPCCSAQHTGTELSIRSACAHVALPGNAISKEAMLNGVVTASESKRKLPEAGETPRKKRKRGRRQARRIACALKNCMQQQERSCVPLITEIDVDGTCMLDCEKVLRLKSKESVMALDSVPMYNNTKECRSGGNRTEENTHSQFPHRTKEHLSNKIKICEETLGCYMTDRLNAHCPYNGNEGNNADSKLNYNPCRVEEERHDTGTIPNNSKSIPGNCSATQDNPCNKDNKHNLSEDMDGTSKNTKDTHTDHHQYENKQTKSEKISVSNDCSKDKADVSGNTAPQSHSYNSTDRGYCKNSHIDKDKTKPQSHNEHKSNPSDTKNDCRGIDRNDANGHDDIDGGQSAHFHSNQGSDCNHCANGDNNATEALMSAHRGQRVEPRHVEKEQQEGEEKQMVRKKLKEKTEEWERVWARRKNTEKEDRERRKERDFEPYPEKRPCFPHALPPHCIPIHTPLLLPPSLSSSSSSSAFSFHHTIVQHHLSLIPPPPSHLPVHSYPHFFPSFSPHLSPLSLNPAPALPPPPPPPPTFYATPPIALLDPPGPFPLAAAFHPPSLFPPTHPAVLPLQMLF